MTERRPPHEPVPTWVDRLVREATDRGAFDDLPGAGKPLPGIDEPLHEDWWIRQKLHSEDLPADGLLPPALQLRKQLAALPDTVRVLRDEGAVRAVVRDLNARVAAYVRTPTGPVLPVSFADADAVVEQWRAESSVAHEAPGPHSADAHRSGRRHQSWRRWLRRPTAR